MVKHKEYRRVSTVYIPMYHEEWMRNTCGRHEVCWVKNMSHQWGTDWAIRYMKWYETKKWSMWLHHGKHLYEMRSIITGGWMFPVILRDEVWCLDIRATSQELCSLLKLFHLIRNWNLLRCQRLSNISSTSHSGSLLTTIGSGRACGFLPDIRSFRVADNLTTLNTGCNCLNLWGNLSW